MLISVPVTMTKHGYISTRIVITPFLRFPALFLCFPCFSRPAAPRLVPRRCLFALYPPAFCVQDMWYTYHYHKRFEALASLR